MVTKVGNGNCKPSLPGVKQAQRSSLPPENRLSTARGQRSGAGSIAPQELAPFDAHVTHDQISATIPATTAISRSPRQNQEAA
jgi:hypothetical protein